MKRDGLPTGIDIGGGRRNRSFNWNDLAYFLELGRQRHLTLAGKRLRVDHTTVSRRVRELENALNVKLFSRTRYGFVLTDAGLKLLEYAEAIENNTIAISQALGHSDEDVSGTVRVATMEALGSLYLAPNLKTFKDQYPAITIELVTAAHWINLSKREADVLISFSRPSGKRLSVNKVGEFQLRLYASRDYLDAYGEPQTLEDLQKHRFVDYIDDLVQIDAVRWLSDVVRDPGLVFRSTSQIAQYNSVIAGMGIAMLPSFVAARDQRLRPIMAPRLSVKRDFYLTVHEDLLHLSRVSTTARFLRNLIERDQPFLNGLET